MISCVPSQPTSTCWLQTGSREYAELIVFVCHFYKDCMEGSSLPALGTANGARPSHSDIHDGPLSQASSELNAACWFCPRSLFCLRPPACRGQDVQGCHWCINKARQDPSLTINTFRFDKALFNHVASAGIIETRTGLGSQHWDFP